MSKIPEFKFDFDVIEGQSVDEAIITLFKQMEDHYNENIKPAPIIFGGKKLAAPSAEDMKGDWPVKVEPNASVPKESADKIPVTDWEIKHDETLKSDVLNGIRFDTKTEVFDVIRKKEGDLVIGDSGTYLLDRKKK